MLIKQIALRWIDNNIKSHQWPEYRWVYLTLDYDLKIFTDCFGDNRAILYHVIDGNTDIDRSMLII